MGMSFFTKHKQAIYVTLYLGLLCGVVWLYVTLYVLPDQATAWPYLPDDVTVIKMDAVFRNPVLRIGVANYDDPFGRGSKRTAIMYIYSEREAIEDEPLIVYEGFRTWRDGYSISVLNVTTAAVSLVIRKVE
jgi:hypothetical protein